MDELLNLTRQAESLGAFGMVVIALVYMYRERLRAQKELEDLRKDMKSIMERFSNTIEESNRGTAAAISVATATKEVVREMAVESRTRGQMLQSLYESIRGLSELFKVFTVTEADTNRIILDLDRFIREKLNKNGGGVTP